MRQVVRDEWIAFTEPLEGGVASLYADVRGKVTIAYGNLVDTLGEVAALPLVRADGSLASVAEKIAAWNVVHDDPRAPSLGWRYAARLSPLRLPRDAMTALALRRLDDNDRILSARIRDWDDHTACCQMALHSLAWACGANAHFPRLFTAVNARDWDAAAVEIHMNEVTPEGVRNVGLVPRNLANKILLRNAGRVEAYHLDPDVLDWTHVLGVSEAETLPALPDSSPIVHADPTLYWLDKDPDDAA